MSDEIILTLADIAPESPKQLLLESVRKLARTNLENADTLADSLKWQYIAQHATEKDSSWLFEKEEDLGENRLIQILTIFSKSEEEARSAQSLLDKEQNLNTDQILVTLDTKALGSFKSRMLVTVPRKENDGKIVFVRLYVRSIVPCVQTTIDALLKQGISSFQIDSGSVEEIEGRLWTNRERPDITTYEPYEDPTKNELFLVCVALGSIGSIRKDVNIIQNQFIENNS